MAKLPVSDELLELTGPLLSLRRSRGPLFYHLHALGSADRLTDASQAVADSHLYKALGVLDTSTGSTVNPFRFVAA